MKVYKDVQCSLNVILVGTFAEKEVLIAVLDFFCEQHPQAAIAGEAWRLRSELQS